jgi:hypothetical protein
MSVQLAEKSLNFHSPPTTTMSTVNKTPFGIEDILYINNNNNNSVQSANKNHQMMLQVKKAGAESEEFKKLAGSER